KQIEKVKKHKLKVAATISDLTKKGINHIDNLLKLKTDLICIETAHAHNTQTIEFIRQLKKKFPKIEICASLVVTKQATLALIKAGVDSIRVGIGGGSHCTTRLVTGIGRPQLSAIHDCISIAKKYKIPVISDTGIKQSGDIAKAIAFGADSVMIGGLFTGTDQCPGNIIKKQGKKYKYSAGMCTNDQQKTNISAVRLWRKQNTLSYQQIIKNYKYKLKNSIKSIIGYKKQIPSYSVPFSYTTEGVSGLIPYKGSVIPIINQLTGGLKRSMWYLGAHNLNDVQKKTKIITVTPNTYQDNIPRI
ncbi:IMP dehydrogenase, partial [Patescibacteria group bacterium]|nr:IMP dehydrogenase [Patescibacteria group bacterium]